MITKIIQKFKFKNILIWILFKKSIAEYKIKNVFIVVFNSLKCINIIL